MTKKTVRIISIALLTYLAIQIVTLFLGIWTEDGTLLNAWYTFIDRIPFGSKLGTFCVNVFSDSFEIEHDMTRYLLNIKSLGIKDVLEDICLLAVTALIFEAGNNILQILLGVKGRISIHDVIIQMLCGMVSVIICTLLASILMNYLYTKMDQLSSIVQSAISILIALLTIGGSFGFMYFVLEISALGALLFVGIKVLFINILKVLITYSSILFIILFISEEAYLKMFAVFAGWGGIIIVLLGLDMLVSILFREK